jgi:hypothetical protein
VLSCVVLSASEDSPHAASVSVSATVAAMASTRVQAGKRFMMRRAACGMPLVHTSIWPEIQRASRMGDPGAAGYTQQTEAFKMQDGSSPLHSNFARTAFDFGTRAPAQRAYRVAIVAILEALSRRLRPRCHFRAVHEGLVRTAGLQIHSRG